MEPTNQRRRANAKTTGGKSRDTKGPPSMPKAWVSSIETVKSGLQATLIIKRPGARARAVCVCFLGGRGSQATRDPKGGSFGFSLKKRLFLLVEHRKDF